MSKLFAALCGLSVTLLASCQSDRTGVGPVPPPAMPQAHAAPSNAVAIGESLEVFVMEDPSFSGTYRVRERGDIILPKLGRIDVVGMSVEAVQTKIKAGLEASQLKSATVIVDRVGKVTPASISDMPKLLVYVVGSVNRPGQHMIALQDEGGGGGATAYEAVLIAGGVNMFADEKHAYVLRRTSSGERSKIPVDLRALRMGTGRDVPLGEGDMIVVPQRRFMF